MVKIKQLSNCKHPNSRKTLALAKEMKKQVHRKKSKFAQNIKQNLLGEKLEWFKERLPENKTCSPEEIDSLVVSYLSRFDEELEQIRIKHSIGNRKNRQHASREDVINMTIEREKTEYETCGLELPDLLNPVQVEMLRNWTGELRFLPNFKLRRISKKFISSEMEKRKTNLASSNNSNQTEEMSTE